MKLTTGTVIGCLLALLIIGVFVSCQSEGQIEFSRYFANGDLIYQERCQNCHGVHGEGLQALIPPLNDSAYLKTNISRLPCSIKNGLKGKIVVNNKSFEGEMLPIDLPPVEIAEVLTYINNSFGNKTGTVNVQEVELILRKCN